MTLFANQYAQMRWPLATDTAPGLRTPQAGALHAIAAHFSRYQAPGIISMPTGAGKTAVLMAAPFLLRARRVLVITPSRLVREQISDRFSQLDPLRVLGVIDKSLPLPSVHSVEHRVQAAADWDQLRAYDVVVGTPHTLSPAIEGIPGPPSDLFDLVLVDEAHHSPARTWAALLDHFSDARQILFTATPFRTDRRELIGDFIYSYELRQAYEDGVFGQLEYVPVNVSEAETDMAIAERAESLLNADRAQGLNHLLMVRTATRTRAKQLSVLYEKNTELRLQLITGDNSLGFVRATLAKLRSGKLDGIICVDMLGEGFDLPELKVAALHAPHRSLAITLQFIGRFARTTASNIGRAAFVASVSDMTVERESLYAEGAVWEEMIPRLSGDRIEREEEVRRVLARFKPSTAGPTASIGQSFEDVSLHSFWPYHHAKIFRVVGDAPVDITASLTPSPTAIEIYRRTTEDGTSLAVIKSNPLPEWTGNDRFAGLVFDLVVVSYHEASRLLFIHSSSRTDGLYETIAERVAKGRVRPLSLNRLNKVLIGLENPEFFNIGMRNRVLSSTTETYRIITGPDAAGKVQQSDGRLFHQGHFFGRANENGQSMTLGLSSGSKVWSNAYDRLPVLLEWMKNLAGKLTSSQSPKTYSGLDHLSTGREVDTIPPDVIAVDWDRDVYESPPLVEWTTSDGTHGQACLIDSDLRVIPDRSDSGHIGVDVCFEDFTYPVTFSYDTPRYFTAEKPELSVRVSRAQKGIPLLDFLNGQLLSFYTASLGLLHGNDFFEQDGSLAEVFDTDAIEVIDWAAHHVDIAREIICDRPGFRSIHDFLRDELQSTSGGVAFYDHGSGEIADYVTISDDTDTTQIRLYHCKGANSSDPGRRLNDAYEVCCQAIKSVIWTTRRQTREGIRRRLKSRPGKSHFLKGKGTQEDVDRLLGDGVRRGSKFEMLLVQPGISQSDVHPGVSAILAATNDFLVRGGCAPLRVYASA